MQFITNNFLELKILSGELSSAQLQVDSNTEPDPVNTLVFLG